MPSFNLLDKERRRLRWFGAVQAARSCSAGSYSSLKAGPWVSRRMGLQQLQVSFQENFTVSLLGSSLGRGLAGAGDAVATISNKYID